MHSGGLALSESVENGEDFTLKQMLFSTEGRIARLDAIFAAVSVLIVLCVLAALWISFAMEYYRQDLFGVMHQPPVAVPVAVMSVVVLWALVCILGKRCHDRDRSVWFLLVGLIPVVDIWVLVELFFLRGSRDLNHFGPVPKSMVSQWHEANSDM